ncbi:hypothetical protein GQ37_011785 [Janthinobacterium sp. BJB1]|uniref:hypothetical protein n=1 Tax=Janthinobacterium sp. GW458P TaxID=1981504 RepID=UPI000A323690|nr:hypothetical protein [Janthinobacterium sp. GW458P]MBE3023405.1 hypothetical protein [Janthinobacterium sp. GW458P]PHV18902.1 hypothetical protein CSQ90_04150 [Janthinobacterium sp. BJB303]PJC98355.1 hypothetical protein GQ37_011785 [Janthinobacterium sp. BJB1]
MKHIDTIALQGSIADMRGRIAAEQSAMHKVQLGLARWRGALPEQDADGASPAPASQARWHAEAQCHFMCWLEQGGFALAEEEADQAAPAASMAHGTKGAGAQAKPSTAPISPAHCNDCAA